MPRPTKAQLLTREQNDAKLARYKEQEAKRATRIMADTGPVLLTLLILSGVALLTSFVFSYFALVEVAEWMKPPQPGLVWLVPGFIEIVIVLSALDFVVARSRGESGRTPFWMMVAMSAVAVIGNAAHTFFEWLAVAPVVPWQGWLGVALSAIVPLVVVYISKRITSTVFSEPIVLD